MKPIFYIVFFSLNVYSLAGQQLKSIQDEQKVHIKGQILAASDMKIIEQAHIVIPADKTGTVSDFMGNFSISVERGKIVVVTSLGFEADTIYTDKLAKFNHLNFMLEEKSIELPDVEIYPFPYEYAYFKEHFLDMQIEGIDYHIDLELPSTKRGLSKIQAPNTGFGIAFTSPITWLYNMFSKKVKSQKEYLRLIKEDAYRAKLAEKYNSELVAKLTGLEDESQIEALMEYCDLPDPFVEFNDMYNILEAVQTCWNEFKSK